MSLGISLLKFIVFCTLQSALSGPLLAQGMLPGTPPGVELSSGPYKPLLIGEKVPESLALVNEDAKRRPLLSYKAPVEIMVVTCK